MLIYITEDSFCILTDIGESGKQKIYSDIEKAARICYKSENLITEGSAQKMVRSLIKRGHEAMLEHASIAVLFITDRGITHELVRHREASFAQESTRWCNYSKDKFENNCTFINPYQLIKDDQISKNQSNTQLIYDVWCEACLQSENAYMKMLELGASPQVARSVLNNSLKSEIVVTANIREWRHIFKMRAVETYGKPHPQMKALMHSLLEKFAEAMPELFDDILMEEQANEQR